MIADGTELAVLAPGARVRGVVPGAPVVVVAAQPIGQAAVKITYEYGDGQTGQRLVYPSDLPDLSVEDPHDRDRRFDGDGTLFRLAAEALRIRQGSSIPCLPCTPRSWSRSRTRSGRCTASCCRACR
jgi:DUF971 family protein